VNLIPESQREYNNITLMVIPEEAEILTLASELGNLTLSLRNEEDVDMIEERGRATITTLLSGERTRVLEQKRREIIQIIKGSASEKSAVGSSGTP
jgi:pilus assembly protein CpaB